ncbi:MAG: riboflavin synthase [Gammaproteobacteria bacterium]|nr:riboflavin synthase [Gammaproteobacteria bacterium]MDC0225249.1 riboflavin synthase [Gammaproteobacteria bacterium]MDC3239849.1 riboflavin synthase [Gammaproteobacteria bacterium]|tara:strand:+ start:233 stop:820 length:588 start_codon:yes stop_codon:yes gene_type:complete
MFSGIVEGQATLSSKKEEKSIVRMEFKTTGFNPADLDLGASIAINGVCLTATSLNKDSFSVDVSTETLKCTNIGELEVEDVVNIEQSLKIGDSIDGHFVFGHVDEVSTVQNIEVLDQTKILHFSLSQEGMRFVVKKGSIAIDGVSLTVNEVSNSGFQVMIIPHTLEKTSFNDFKKGTRANIEYDMLARYVQNQKD